MKLNYGLGINHPSSQWTLNVLVLLMVCLIALLFAQSSETSLKLKMSLILSHSAVLLRLSESLGAIVHLQLNTNTRFNCVPLPINI